MTSSDRFGFASGPHAETTVEQDQVERFELFLDSATGWANSAGRSLGATRQWVESEAIGSRPLTTLVIAFGLGVLTGWLVKRR